MLEVWSTGVSPGTPEWPAGRWSPSSTTTRREGTTSTAGTADGTPEWPTSGCCSPSSTTTWWEGSMSMYDDSLGDSNSRARLTSGTLGLGGTGDMLVSPPPLGCSGTGCWVARSRGGWLIHSASAHRPLPVSWPALACLMAKQVCAASSRSTMGRTGTELDLRGAVRLWALGAGASSRGESGRGQPSGPSVSRISAPLLPCRLIVAR